MSKCNLIQEQAIRQISTGNQQQDNGSSVDGCCAPFTSLGEVLSSALGRIRESVSELLYSKK